MNLRNEAFLYGSDSSEARLRREIAYFKARIADIRNAPPNSKHRESLHWVEDRLLECERQLEAVRSRH